MNQNFPPAPSQPNRSISPLDWPTFSTINGGFNIKFPDFPTPSTGVFEHSGLKLPLTLFSYFDQTNLINFSVNFVDFPHTLESPLIVNKLFDGIRDNVVKNPGSNRACQLLSETALTLNGHPGRLWTIEIDHQGILRSKSLAVGNRLYQVVALAVKLGTISSTKQEDLAKRFLDSFELDSPEKPLFIE